MRTQRIVSWVGLIAASLIPAFAGGTFESRWLDREVVIDGAMDEWQDAMVTPGDGLATLGVMNDGTHLYVCLKSWDRRANLLAMSQGLILRLTPRAKKSVGVGLRFPVGVEDENAAEAAPAFVEVLEDGKDRGRRLAGDGSEGFWVRAELDDGMLIYELKIPLRRSADEPYAVGAGPGEQVTVTFETTTVDLEAMRERMGGDRMGGGRGGVGGGVGGGIGGVGGGVGVGGGLGRGGGPGGGGPRGGGPPPERPEPLKIKAKIQLATQGGTGKK